MQRRGHTLHGFIAREAAVCGRMKPRPMENWKMDVMDEAKKAINEVFSDNSVPVATTRERLGRLREEIDDLLETLPTE